MSSQNALIKIVQLSKAKNADIKNISAAMKYVPIL